MKTHMHTKRIQDFIKEDREYFKDKVFIFQDEFVDDIVNLVEKKLSISNIKYFKNMVLYFNCRAFTLIYEEDKISSMCLTEKTIDDVYFGSNESSYQKKDLIFII